MISDIEKSMPSQSSPKFVSGIDTLDFFVKINYDDYTSFYHNHLLKGVLDYEDCLVRQSEDFTRQWTWYDYYINIASEGSARDERVLCTIKFKNLNQKDNNDSVLIEMRSSIMNLLGYQTSVNIVLMLLKSFTLEPLKTQVSRVDLNTYCLGHNFQYLTYENFSTKAEKCEPINKFGVLETFRLGARSSTTIYMRIYDKYKQLLHLSQSNFADSNLKSNLIYSKFFHKYGLELDTTVNLWNIEFEVKRGILKTFEIHTIEDLFNKVDSLHKYIVEKKFRMLIRKKDKTNNSLIKTHPLWEKLSNEFRLFNEPTVIDRTKLKLYKKDDEWFKNRMTDFIKEHRNVNSPMLEDIKALLSKYS